MVFNPWVAAGDDTSDGDARKKKAAPTRKVGVPPPARVVEDNAEPAASSYAAQFAGKGGATRAPVEAPAGTSYASLFAGDRADSQVAEEVDLRPSVAVQEPAPEPPPAAPASEEAQAVGAIVPPARKLLDALRAKREELPSGDLARLHRKVEKQVRSNSRELSLLEGNFLNINRTLCTVYVSSCFDGEGKTTTATHIAYGLAELAKRNVLLIDSNGDAPKLHKYLCAGNELGLREVLEGKATALEAIQPSVYEGLYLLSAGNGHVAMHDQALVSLMDTLRANFDFIIIDGKSVLVSSGPSNVAPLVDLFLLVVECESTKWEVVQMAHEKLTHSGAKHAAVVLNRRRFYVPRTVYKILSKR